MTSPLPDFAIEARGLVKTYAASKTAPAKTALRGIDLAVPRGSMFGLLGPNGAGKSTFINILAGLVKKSEGEVSIWGTDIDRHPRKARAALGVVPQELAADVFFTPQESLEVQAGLYGVPKGERRTMEILTALGLGDKAGAAVRSLSGGMKRRLMVAKAMVHSPPVLILDEPTAGVDVELRRQLWAHVQELNAQGVTIVLTTHYLEEAQALCDRIAIVNHGRVVASESTRDLLRRMDTRAVVITPQSPLERAPSPVGLRRQAPKGRAIGGHLPQRGGGRRAGSGRRARRGRADSRPLHRRAGPGGRVPGADLQRPQRPRSHPRAGAGSLSPQPALPNRRRSSKDVAGPDTHS